MHGFVTNIEQATLSNDNFRKVLFTGPHEQLVVMSLLPDEDIGEETHEVDQFVRIEQGEGQVVMDGEVERIKDESAFVIPAGTKHNVINKGAEPLKLYSVYSSPQHEDGAIHETKEEAEEAEGH